MVSSYRTAIHQTTRIIDRRAKYFRNLIVAVTALGMGFSSWAAIAWTFSPLAGLILLIPACGFFFYLDGKLLDNWRCRLVDAWAKKDIDFRSFQDAINAIPKLPKNTVRSMLATLPVAEDLIAEQGISSSTREAVAAAVTGMCAHQSDTILWKAIAAAVLSGSVVMAVVRRTWEPLLGILALFLLPILRTWLRRRRVEVLDQRMLAVRNNPGFNKEKYAELVGCLQSTQISWSEKDEFLKI